jgi:hypothetical protein
MQKIQYGLWIFVSFYSISVAEPHNFYAAPAPGKNVDAAPVPTAPAPASVPTLLYTKLSF